MTDISILKKFEKKVPTKTINEILQPWIVKYGIEEVRALVSAIETGGYKFVESESINYIVKWFRDYEEDRQAKIKMIDGIQKTCKELDENIKEVSKANERMGKVLNPKNNKWWSWW